MSRASRATPSAFARRINRGLAAAALAGLAVAVSIALVRDASWYEQRWPGEPAVGAVERAAEPNGRVFATSHFADWVLWKVPELRGRVAYDVRFEIYTPEVFDRIVDFRARSGSRWRSLADGYDVLVLEPEQPPSTVDELAAEPGAAIVYREDGMVVVSRSRPP